MKLYICETMDGFIAKPDGNIDFLDPFNEEIITSSNPAIASTYTDFIKPIKNIIQGYTTYKQMDDAGYGDFYASYNNYVITNQHQHLKDDNVTDFINFEQLAGLNLKDQETFLIGGSKVITESFKRQLVTEIIVFRLPIFLGSGIPLFDKIPTNVEVSIEEIIHDERFSQTHYLVNYQA